MNPDRLAVQLHLEDRRDPIRAERIAEDLRMPVETVYACLVSLYDEGLAAIDMDRHQNRVRGWVDA